MNLNQKKWIYKKVDQKKVEELSLQFGISPTLATLLLHRNISSSNEVELFLNPDLAKLHNPFLLPNMEKAVVRVRQAMESHEKILIFGDRDVDGVTSIAILVRTLKGLGADVCWTIPAEDSHGLSKKIIEQYAKEGVKLIITADCGTSQVEEIAFAASLGVEVIVTDHHLPPDELPKAYSIVNPNLKNSIYPMKQMAGCLTAFKFSYALMFSFNRTFNQEFVVLDLETTGLSLWDHEIIEVGALLLRNFVPCGQFHSLVRPTKPISKGAEQVHGITLEMVKDAPQLKEVLPKLLKFIGDRTIIAHNAKFDLGFLQTAVQKIMGREFQNNTIDTLSLSRTIFPFESHALGALAKELKIEMKQAHRSLDDCLATAIVYKRIEELRDPRLQFFLEDMLDIITLGTVADVVPLVGENRIVVKHGLTKLLQTRKVGLRKILLENGLKEDGNSQNISLSPTAKDVGWKITPLMNAAGRFSKAHLAVQLLLTNSEEEAAKLFNELAELNQNRKALQKINLEKFIALAKEQADLENDKIIFVVAEGVEHGVTGIVANRMLQEFQRPIILLILEGEEARGSARSLSSFNLIVALNQCKDLLIRYGGHAAAAGMSIAKENIDLLRERIKKIAAQTPHLKILEPCVEIDLELELNAISLELMQELEKLEPLGEGNPAPLFSLRQAEVVGQTLMGQDKSHLQLSLGHNGKSLRAVGWDMARFASELKKGEQVDCIFYLELDRWKERNLPMLLLKDLQKSVKILVSPSG
ncbi:MAG: single-stranded-DNA-specific exonuclease RecJ [Elusimicrobia bacterium]|nr:single-stranded-DNA-specific exonuclease RecJ [Elusimicrobiota bacterium]